MMVRVTETAGAALVSLRALALAVVALVAGSVAHVGAHGVLPAALVLVAPPRRGYDGRGTAAAPPGEHRPGRAAARGGAGGRACRAHRPRQARGRRAARPHRPRTRPLGRTPGRGPHPRACL